MCYEYLYKNIYSEFFLTKAKISLSICNSGNCRIWLISLQRTITINEHVSLYSSMWIKDYVLSMNELFFYAVYLFIENSLFPSILHAESGTYTQTHTVRKHIDYYCWTCINHFPID